MTPDWPANRYLFVSGCPRSGTSVLKKILRGHPGFVGIGVEHGYLLAMVDHFGPMAPSIEEALDAFEEHQWAFGDRSTPRTAEAWGQSLDQPVEWETFFRRLHGLHVEPDGDTTLVLQYPGPGILRCEDVATIFPEARFLSLERDPRANVSSQLAAFDEHRSTLRSVRLWKQCIDAARSAESRVDLMRLRYEDLVADPRTHLAEICEFSGVAWEDAILDFEVSMPDISTDRTVEHRTVTSLDPAFSEKWKAGLAPYQIWLVERMAATEMELLGYEQTDTTLRPSFIPHLATDALGLVWERLSAKRAAR